MTDRDAILKINQAFYKAFEALDFDAMCNIWSQQETDVCIHPGWEILFGWTMIKESWRAIFANTGYMRFEPSEVTSEIRGDLARITCVENIFSVVNDMTIHSRVACTNLFARHEEGWRMVLHHGSPIASAQSMEPASSFGDDPN